MPNISPRPQSSLYDVRPQIFNRLSVPEKYRVLDAALRDNALDSCGWWQQLASNDRKLLMEYKLALPAPSMPLKESRPTRDHMEEDTAFAHEFNRLIDIYGSPKHRTIDFQLQLQRESRAWIRNTIANIATVSRKWRVGVQTSAPGVTRPRKRKSAASAAMPAMPIGATEAITQIASNAMQGVDSIEVIIQENDVAYFFPQETQFCAFVRKFAKKSRPMDLEQEQERDPNDQNDADAFQQKRRQLLQYFDARTMSMSLSQYQYFSNLRGSASFLRAPKRNRRESRFKKWISPTSQMVRDQIFADSSQSGKEINARSAQQVEDPPLADALQIYPTAKITVDFHDKGVLQTLDFLLHNRVAQVLRGKSDNVVPASEGTVRNRHPTGDAP